MKTLKLKHSLSGGGNLSPQQANAEPGYRNGVMTIAVTGLPDAATFRDAIKVVESIIMPSWVNTVDAAQSGRNLYRRENLTVDQIDNSPEWYQEKYC